MNGSVSNYEDNRNVLCDYHKKELNFKIVVIGDFGVGKTSIIRRYIGEEFRSIYKVTVGADFSLKTIEWDEHTRINLHLWDIAGNERFESLTGIFYRHAVAAAIVYDITRPQSFQSVDIWLQDLRRKVRLPEGRSVPVIVLANKGDVGDLNNISIEDMNNYCQKNGILTWLITSARFNLNLDEAIKHLVNAALNDHYRIEIPVKDEEVVSLTEPSPNDKKYCCQR